MRLLRRKPPRRARNSTCKYFGSAVSPSHGICRRTHLGETQVSEIGNTGSGLKKVGRFHFAPVREAINASIRCKKDVSGLPRGDPVQPFFARSSGGIRNPVVIVLLAHPGMPSCKDRPVFRAGELMIGHDFHCAWDKHILLRCDAIDGLVQDDPACAFKCPPARPMAKTRPDGECRKIRRRAHRRPYPFIRPNGRARFWSRLYAFAHIARHFSTMFAFARGSILRRGCCWIIGIPATAASRRWSRLPPPVCAWVVLMRPIEQSAPLRRQIPQTHKSSHPLPMDKAVCAKVPVNEVIMVFGAAAENNRLRRVTREYDPKACAIRVRLPVVHQSHSSTNGLPTAPNIELGGHPSLFILSHKRKTRPWGPGFECSKGRKSSNDY